MTDPGGHGQTRSPETERRARLVNLAEAADYLGLPPEAVQALVDGGFLRAVDQQPDGPRLALAELRAFMVWNVEDDDEVIDLDAEAGGPERLLQALERRSGEMAQQAFQIFAQVFPEAEAWSASARARFVEQARSRFEAILAVARRGGDLDEVLAGDLKGAGAAAAWDGAPLPQLLMVLRISRDLVVQTAIEEAQDRGGSGLALSLLLTRVLPAVDRLTDSLAQGYWSAVIGRQKEARARYEHIVEHSSDGVYEVDLEGRIQYANPRLGLILGRRRLDELEGALITEVMESVSGPSTAVLLHPSGGPERLQLTIARPDGVRRVLDVRTIARLKEGEPVGFQGVVRDITARHDFEVEKDQLLASLLGDLRLALVRVADLGAGLEAEGGRLSAERLQLVGKSILGHVEPLSSLMEDLARVSRMAVEAPVLASRPVELGDVVSASVANGGAAREDVEVHVPAGLRVMADPEGLVRAVGDLLAEAVRLGPAPVRVEVEGVAAGELRLVVAGQGRGVGAPGDEERVRRARALVEAMGGRVWYDVDPDGGGRFRLTMPVPNRRRGDDAIRL